jgi:hypothetical protein
MWSMENDAPQKHVLNSTMAIPDLTKSGAA